MEREGTIHWVRCGVITEIHINRAGRSTIDAIGNTLESLVFHGDFHFAGTFIPAEDHRMPEIYLAEIICPGRRLIAVFVGVQPIMRTGGVP